MHLSRLVYWHHFERSRANERKAPYARPSLSTNLRWPGCALRSRWSQDRRLSTRKREQNFVGARITATKYCGRRLGRGHRLQGSVSALIGNRFEENGAMRRRK